jgi:hypothetical protein
MASASAIFDTIAPQYASDSNKASFIVLARDRTSLEFFGDNYEQAVALRAAHMMTLTNSRSSGGTGSSESGSVASKREGDLAISFAQGAGEIGIKSSDLSQTHYGVQLMGLIKGSGAFIGVTGGRDNGY